MVDTFKSSIARATSHISLSLLVFTAVGCAKSDPVDDVAPVMLPLVQAEDDTSAEVVDTSVEVIPVENEEVVDTTADIVEEEPTPVSIAEPESESILIPEPEPTPSVVVVSDPTVSDPATATDADGDDEYPKPDGDDCPAGFDYFLGIDGDLCAAKCDSGCPEPADPNSDAVPACVYLSKTASYDDCSDDDDCDDDELCLNFVGDEQLCAFESDLCGLRCDNGETCPDGMSCADKFFCTY